MVEITKLTSKSETAELPSPVNDDQNSTDGDQEARAGHFWLS